MENTIPNEGQTMVLIQKCELDELNANIKRLEKKLEEKDENSILEMYVDSEKARKMLGVSKRTWQLWRDGRKIPFSQYGRKIYVQMKDIEAFMKANYISTNNR